MGIFDWLLGKRASPYATLQPVAVQVGKTAQLFEDARPFIQHWIGSAQYMANSYRFVLDVFPDGDPQELRVAHECADAMRAAYLALDTLQRDADAYAQAARRLAASLADAAGRKGVTNEWTGRNTRRL